MKHITQATSPAATLSPNQFLGRSDDSPAEPNYLRIALVQLEPALAQLKPQHRALFLTILNDVDVKVALNLDGQLCHRSAPYSLIELGLAAVRRLPKNDGFFTDEQYSITRLACLLYEFGSLYPHHPRGAGALQLAVEDIEQVEMGISRCRCDYAHPYTWPLVAPHVEPLQATDPELVRYLRSLLGNSKYVSARLGSYGGPLSANPVEPWQAHMRERVLGVFSGIWTPQQRRRQEMGVLNGELTPAERAAGTERALRAEQVGLAVSRAHAQVARRTEDEVARAERLAKLPPELASFIRMVRGGISPDKPFYPDISNEDIDAVLVRHIREEAKKQAKQAKLSAKATDVREDLTGHADLDVPND